MSKISPCLWFDGQAEGAAQFYTSILPDSRIDKVQRAAADNPSTDQGAVLTVDFTLAGQQFIGLNGGPEFKFNEAISLSIDCADQAEVDRLWGALVEGGGEHSVCGWLKDRFGVCRGRSSRASSPSCWLGLIARALRGPCRRCWR